MLFRCGQGKLLGVVHGDDVDVFCTFHLGWRWRFRFRVSLAFSATGKRFDQAKKNCEAEVKPFSKVPHKISVLPFTISGCPHRPPETPGYASLPSNARVVR